MKESLLKKTIVFIIILMLGKACGRLIGFVISGGLTQSSYPQIDVTNITDVPIDSVIEHKVVKRDAQDGTYIYCVILYGKDTHIVKDLYVEYLGDKEDGYRLEYVDQDLIKNTFPSFSEFSVEETEDYVVVRVKMKDLESKDKIQALVDKELIQMKTDGPIDLIDADYLYNSYLEFGYTDAPTSDYELLDLSR